MSSSPESPRTRWLRNFGLLGLRLGAAAFMVYGHGWAKLAGFAERSESFGDPLGIGSMWSLVLAIFAEVFCSALVALGLLTRLAAVPVVVTMSVAAFMVHGDDPFNDRELALVYLMAFATLIFTGPGDLSVDRYVFGKRR